MRGKNTNVVRIDHRLRFPSLYDVFTVLFFVSGSAGLVYEIIWMRKLSLFFGSDIYSSSITLATFMGGFALGGYLASRFVDKIRNHLFVYGILEIIIGIYALLFGKLLSLFDPFIAALYSRWFEYFPLGYQFVRGCIAFILLVVPTMMMGATLPIILKFFTRHLEEYGRTAGHFYAVNTFGALIGVFLSAFILLPKLGFRSTNFIAAAMNMGIGIISMFLAMMRVSRASFSSSPSVPFSNHVDLKGAEHLSVTQLCWRRAAFMAIGVSGFGSFALEVIWTRILIQSYSATVYSFSMMLIGFLLGIALGSTFISRYISSPQKAFAVLAKIQIAIAFSIVFLAGFSFFIPRLFGIIVWGLSALSSKLFTLASIMGTLLLSTLFILPCTMLIGASFPAALRVYNSEIYATGRNSGRIVAINTIGCVIGALAGGFVFIPLFGGRHSLLLLSFLYFMNGLYIQKNILTKVLIALKGLSIPLVLLFIFMTVIGFMPYQVILNYDLQKNTRPNIVYHSEGIDGVLDVIKNPDDTVILSLDGNVEADNSLRQRKHFILKAHLPLMLSPDAQEVLIVGLGLGITVSSVLKHPNLKRIDVIEILPSVIKAQEYLKNVNGDVLSDPRLNLHIDDGRNFLKFTKNMYDVITADPAHPRISGMGLLYTQEYYRLMYEKLKDDGIVLQWMPLYSISAKSFRVAVKTMVTVFPNTSVWYVPGHVLLLGAKTTKLVVFDYTVLASKFADNSIAADFKSIGINTILEFLCLRIMSPAQVSAFLSQTSDSIPINTEGFPYLEYRTPFEFLISVEKNLESLLPFVSRDVQFVINAPDGFLEGLTEIQESYIKTILSGKIEYENR